MRCVIFNIFKLARINKINYNMRYRFKNINYIKDNVRCFIYSYLYSLLFVYTLFNMSLFQMNLAVVEVIIVPSKAAIWVILKKALTVYASFLDAGP